MVGPTWSMRSRGGRCRWQTLGGQAVTVAGGDVDSGRSLSYLPLSIWPGRSEVQESNDPKPLDMRRESCHCRNLPELARVVCLGGRPAPWALPWCPFSLRRGRRPRVAHVGASFSCWVEAEASVCLLKIFSSLGPCVESPLSI